MSHKQKQKQSNQQAKTSAVLLLYEYVRTYLGEHFISLLVGNSQGHVHRRGRRRCCCGSDWIRCRRGGGFALKSCRFRLVRRGRCRLGHAMIPFVLGRTSWCGTIGIGGSSFGVVVLMFLVVVGWLSWTLSWTLSLSLWIPTTPRQVLHKVRHSSCRRQLQQMIPGLTRHALSRQIHHQHAIVIVVVLVSVVGRILGIVHRHQGGDTVRITTQFLQPQGTNFFVGMPFQNGPRLEGIHHASVVVVDVVVVVRRRRSHWLWLRWLVVFGD